MDHQLLSVDSVAIADFLLHHKTKIAMCIACYRIVMMYTNKRYSLSFFVVVIVPPVSYHFSHVFLYGGYTLTYANEKHYHWLYHYISQ